MPAGGIQERLASYSSSTLQDEREVIPSSSLARGVPPIFPLDALSATLHEGAQWVPSRFPKVAVEAPSVVIPANETTRICIPVHTSESGGTDEVWIDPVLGVN